MGRIWRPGRSLPTPALWLYSNETPINKDAWFYNFHVDLWEDIIFNLLPRPTGTLTATAVEFTETIYRNARPPGPLPEASHHFLSFPFPVHAGNQRSSGVGCPLATAGHLLPPGEASDHSKQPRRQPHRELWSLVGPFHKLRHRSRRRLAAATWQESLQEGQMRSFAHPYPGLRRPRSSFHSGRWLEAQRGQSHFYPPALTVSDDGSGRVKRGNVQGLHAITMRYKRDEMKLKLFFYRVR